MLFRLQKAPIYILVLVSKKKREEGGNQHPLVSCQIVVFVYVCSYVMVDVFFGAKCERKMDITS
jgi:hypothetical protein